MPLSLGQTITIRLESVLQTKNFHSQKSLVQRKMTKKLGHPAGQTFHSAPALYIIIGT